MLRMLGMTRSTYAAIEYRESKITASRLCRILGVLKADIPEVWPPENRAASTVDSELYSMRAQAFGLSKIVTVSKAEGAALTRTVNYEGKSHRELLLHIGLSGDDLERVICPLESGRACTDGLFVGTTLESPRLDLYLKTQAVENHIEPLVNFYLNDIWAHLFLKPKSIDYVSLLTKIWVDP